MRKNISKLISLRQYRLTDLFLFAVILTAFELILHYAFIAFDGDFTFSPMVPVVLLVMMRWGWQCVFFAVGDGLLFCLLNSGAQTFHPYFYAVYAIGNAAIMLLLLMTKFMGKEKIRGKWYFSALFAAAGWLAVVAGRSAVSACFGLGLVNALIAQLSDLVSLAFAVLLVLIMRRLDGMFEDQKHYLLRLDKERKERAYRDAFGDAPVEMDEQAISVLKKWDDEIYK